MRKRFSERNGFGQIRDSLQIDNIDEGLKNRLWNRVKIIFFDTLIGYKYNMYSDDEEYYESDEGMLRQENDKKFILKLYDHFFKDSIEPLSYSKNKIKEDLKKRYFNLEWYEVYDFMEYISEIYHKEEVNIQFRETINQVLEEEMSGYRFVDNYIAPIIDEIEINEVEEALECKYTPVKRHLSTALELLSDRENPDYQNSMKESISAVESVAQLITGQKSTSFSKLIKKMNLNFDTNFGNSMRLLYDWTSKDDGIRHANTEDELKTSFEEAKYMLVSCSAFVNYLIAKNKD